MRFNNQYLLSKYRGWYALILVSIFLVIVAAAFVRSALQANPRQVQLTDKCDRQLIKEALDEASKRSIYYEQLIVAIGSIELGILAYIAGIILTRDNQNKPSRLFYYLATALLFATSGAYLHAWKIYMAYGVYLVGLESQYYPEPALRPIATTFALASKANIDNTTFSFLSRGVYGTMALAAMYPVFLMIAAVVAFGKRLKVDTKVITILFVVVLWTFTIYVAPTLIEFFKAASDAAIKH